MVAVAALSAPPTAIAQTAQDERAARQEMVERVIDEELGNGCQPIFAWLYWTADEEQVDRNSVFRVGPFHESAEELVRNRLRIAGLYVHRQVGPGGVPIPDPSQTEWVLTVGLSTVRGAFVVAVELRVLGEPVTKWEDTVLVSAGTLGWPRRNDMLQVLSESIDRFVLRYRRANRDTCR